MVVDKATFPMYRQVCPGVPLRAGRPRLEVEEQVASTHGSGLSRDLLAHSETVVRAAVDSALAAVVTMSPDGVINGWGARAADTFGWTAAEAVGRRVSELIVPPELRSAHEEGLRRYREGGQGPVIGRVVELEAIDKAGRRFPVELAISSAATTPEGTVFIAFIRDITERRHAQDEIAALYERAEAANRAQRAFVQEVVHEMRAPLGVASGYASMMVDGTLGELPPPILEAVNTLDAKVQEAAHLVDNLLEAFRAEGRGMAIATEEVDLASAAANAVDKGRIRQRLRGGRIDLLAPEEPVLARGDRLYIGRILDNLVNNAIDYSRGAPAVTVRVVPGGQPRVEVADTGRGIAPDHHERVFERFFRVEDHSNPPGSGLGLHMSRQLAEVMGGRLELVRSVPDQGSTFALTLPATAAPTG